MSEIRIAMLDAPEARMVRLDSYSAWTRGELARLTRAGESPKRQAVLCGSLDGVRAVFGRILARRAASRRHNVPFCAEAIRKEAVKCKHCGSVVEPIVDAAPRQPVRKGL